MAFAPSSVQSIVLGPSMLHPMMSSVFSNLILIIPGRTKNSLGVYHSIGRPPSLMQSPLHCIVPLSVESWTKIHVAVSGKAPDAWRCQVPSTLVPLHTVARAVSIPARDIKMILKAINSSFILNLVMAQSPNHRFCF